MIGMRGIYAQASKGYHLTELLLSLFIICILASFATSRLLMSFEESELSARKQSTLADLDNIKRLAETSLGTLPQNYGLSSVLGRFSGLQKITPNTTSVGLCPTGGEDTYQFPSGVIITNVSPKWPDADEAGTLLNADKVCMALNGSRSKNVGKDVFWRTIPRNGPISGPGQEATFVTAAQYNSAFGHVANSIQFYTLITTYLNQAALLLNGSFINLSTFYVMDETGGVTAVNSPKFTSNLYINGVNFQDQYTEYEATYGPYYDMMKAWYTTNASQFVRDTWWNSKGTMTEAEYKQFWVARHVLAGSLLANAAQGVAVAKQSNEAENVVYLDPASNTYYRMIDGVYISPVKLSLNGVSAKLNSDDFFAFDIDGPTAKMHPIQTTGGVNSNEAWLATDRNRDGFWSKGVMDGRDVFGDHVGQYRSGYDDLAALYKHALQKDASGKRYIPLKKLTFVEKQQANVARLSAAPKQLDPSIDLKLLTRDKKVLFAGDYVDKIYVDYQDVNELDTHKRNWIRQRASVHYVSGQTVTSADQWFQAGFVFTPVDKATAQKLMKKTTPPRK